MSQLSLYKSSAVTSPCGRYRYELTRQWSERPLLGWIMLNPSTADATDDDPTIRRCIRFAQREHCGGIVVRNLFAYRASDPRDLNYALCDPTGPENLRFLRRCADDALTVAAWGAHKLVRRGVADALAAIADVELHCLGLTNQGAPRHPLYLRADAPLRRYLLPEDRA